MEDLKHRRDSNCTSLLFQYINGEVKAGTEYLERCEEAYGAYPAGNRMQVSFFAHCDQLTVFCNFFFHHQILRGNET